MNAFFRKRTDGNGPQAKAGTRNQGTEAKKRQEAAESSTEHLLRGVNQVMTK